MKKLCLFLTLAIALWGISCTPAPNSCKKGEIDFEAPLFTPGQIFNRLGMVVYNDGTGLAAGIDSITYVSGKRGLNQSEILSSPPHPFGAGQVLRMNNTVLQFDLKTGTQQATFEYLDQGGTINLSANGAAGAYIGSMYTMPVIMVINGVRIKKDHVQDILNSNGQKVAESGIIILTSSRLADMRIGGQELFLDNFCFE